MMRQYYFFRHGKADSCVADLYRPLTDAGIEKVQKQALQLKDIEFDLLICSEASRTQQTADLLVADANPKRVISQHLWHPADKALSAEIDALVAAVKGACWADYQSQGSEHLYERYAEIIATEIEGACDAESASCVLIIGHAIIINAIAGHLFPQHRERLSKLVLATAEGFMVSSDAMQTFQEMKDA